MAGDACGVASADNEYEGLASQTSVVEQSFEGDAAQAGRQGEDSEGEDIALKLNVSTVVRARATSNRFTTTPHHRSRPAVGGGGGAAELDMQVHCVGWQIAGGVAVRLTSLNDKDGQGRWLEQAQN